MRSQRTRANDDDFGASERRSPGKASRTEQLGTGLPDSLRDRFEHSLGTELSDVRLHTGDEAASASRDLGARAFAVGNDIHFGAGQYQPEDPFGAHLLAHEVAHTVQQRGGAHTAQTKLETSTPGDSLEREADAAAELMVTGAPASVTSGAGLAVARQLDGPTTQEPAAPAAPAINVAQLFTMGGAQAWPTLLPQSTVRAGGLDWRHGARPRHGAAVEPSLVVPRARRSDPEPVAPSGEQAAALQLATETIRARISGIAVPATGGEMLLRNGGYAYRAHTHAEGSPAAAAHDTYMHSDNPLGLTGARELRRWEIFQFVTGEGDTSAINAYDNQIVTLGAGFGARYGAAGRMLNRLPPAMHQRLFDCGIEVEGDASFTVLDVNRGVVEHGENALRVLQVDQARLALFSNLAQSTEEVSEGEETHSGREWMLRAQFEQATSELPDAVYDWPVATAKVAIKLHHWQPGVISWARLVGWGPELSAMCRSARDAIWRHNGQDATGDFSLDEIEARFTLRARQAGAGAIDWSPRPTE
jgi:hypothetical protein